MKAIICTKYGSPDVLQFQEVAKPTPLDNEVLIKIHAASINARDQRMMRANPFFIRLMPGCFWRPKNKILGLHKESGHGALAWVGICYSASFTPGTNGAVLCDFQVGEDSQEFKPNRLC